MKKTVVIIVAILIIALIVFVLFKNKADIAQKAKLTPITSYPVSAVTAARQNIPQDLSQVGVIYSNNDVPIISELEGKVTEVLVDQGAYVSAGAVIVKVESTVPQSALNAKKTAYDNAKKDWERENFLHQKGVVSDSDLEASRNTMDSAQADLATAQQNLNYAAITSPIAGVVTSRSVNLGNLLVPGTLVAEVVDISQFKVDLNIAEEYAFQLKVDDSVDITSDVYPGVHFKGRISSISVKGDSAHTYPVEIIIPNIYNNSHPLKSGMYCTVSFNLPNVDALIIPRTALVGSMLTPQVYVVEDGHAKLRDLLVGHEVGVNLIVLHGLKAGEQVVYNGQDNLKDGIAVRIMTNDENENQNHNSKNKRNWTHHSHSAAN